MQTQVQAEGLHWACPAGSSQHRAPQLPQAFPRVTLIEKGNIQRHLKTAFNKKHKESCLETHEHMKWHW